MRFPPPSIYVLRSCKKVNGRLRVSIGRQFRSVSRACSTRVRTQLGSYHTNPRASGTPLKLFKGLLQRVEEGFVRFGDPAANDDNLRVENVDVSCDSNGERAHRSQPDF